VAAPNVVGFVQRAADSGGDGFLADAEMTGASDLAEIAEIGDALFASPDEHHRSMHLSEQGRRLSGVSLHG
jgi:hypothetical protein